MVNPWLMVAGVGMISVGIIPIVWWSKKEKVSAKYFILGAMVWFVAILPKVIMDVTVTPSLSNYLENHGTVALAIILGLYVGLRTGLFESGFTYIAGLKTKLRQITFDQAVAFGLGFGGVEAMLLGLQSFLTIFLFTLMPDLIDYIPATRRALVLQQLNQSTWIIFAPMIEGVSSLLIHIFASLLVFYSIRINHKRYLVYSVGYKSLVDGIIPALSLCIGTATLLSSYIIELPITGLAVIALGGIGLIREKWIKSLKEEIV
ncbi:MAG: YhfC family intramembrane metalloprotease [Thermoplasmata archaeon]|nr:YhfC family intramembrane metalloprotease [Thermoplasmata archaeon]